MIASSTQPIDAYFIHFSPKTEEIVIYAAPPVISAQNPFASLYPQTDPLGIGVDDEFAYTHNCKYLHLNNQLKCILTSGSSGILRTFCTTNISTVSQNTFTVTCDKSDYEITNTFCYFYPYIRRIEEV